MRVREKNMTTVTTKDLTAVVAEIGGVTKVAAKEQIKNVVEALKVVLAEPGEEGKKLSLQGFGTFKGVHVPATTRVNHLKETATYGQEIEIAAKDTIKFSASKNLA